MSDRKVLYLEPVGGIAGDMFLAAAIDLGVAPEQIERALSGLHLPSWRLSAARSQRHALSGVHVDVVVEPPTAPSHRTLGEIRALIANASTLSGKAKERALAVFQVLGEAESKIHDLPLERVHFHEVGATDALVDICGAAVALELLGEPEVYAAPPPLGSGLLRAEHGVMPIPAPATLEVLRQVPVRFEGEGELTTPTGAALLKALARIEPPGELVLERVGYGLGTRDFVDRPNVLRASLGRRAQALSQLFEVEANLDDCSPQLLGWLVERSLELGALDAYVLPASMKKSRPGHLFAAIVPASAKDAVVESLLTESTTLGVRWHGVERHALERRMESVQTSFGPIRIKLGLRGGEVLNAQPEFEDCKRAAEQSKVPIKQVMAQAVAAYLEEAKPWTTRGKRR